MIGPQLMALITLFIAGYKMSRRQVQEMLADVLGITLSLGTISNTEARVADLLEPAYGEAAEAVNRDSAKNLDATSWRQCGAQRTLWVYASRLATVFSIMADGTTESLRTLVSSLTGILMADRGKQFTFWAMDKRQICWAHLFESSLPSSNTLTKPSPSSATAWSSSRRACSTIGTVFAMGR
jgi:transposase